MLAPRSFVLFGELIKSGLPGAMQLAKITRAYRAFSSFCGIKFSYNKLHKIANWSVLTGDATEISVINFRAAKAIKNSDLCIGRRQPDHRTTAKNTMDLFEIYV